jgi:hypothetical protein
MGGSHLNLQELDMPRLKIKTAWIRNERALHKREMHNPLSSKRQQAEAYAAWLLQRDGIEYQASTLRVTWAMVKIKGRGQQRFCTYSVMTLDGKQYAEEFPHWAFIQPEAVEEVDEPAYDPLNDFNYVGSRDHY